MCFRRNLVPVAGQWCIAAGKVIGNCRSGVALAMRRTLKRFVHLYGLKSYVKTRLHDTTCCQYGCQRFDNRVNVCIHDTAGCQTRCQTGCQTGLINGCIVYTAGCQTGSGWTNSGCSFNTVVKPVVKPVVQRGLTTGWTNSAVRSTRLSNRLSNPFDKWFDNRLNVCLHDTAGCQTRLTTGCIV